MAKAPKYNDEKYSKAVKQVAKQVYAMVREDAAELDADELGQAIIDEMLSGVMDDIEQELKELLDADDTVTIVDL